VEKEIGKLREDGPAILGRTYRGGGFMSKSKVKIQSASCVRYCRTRQFTKSANQVLITRTHSYTRFVGLVTGLWPDARRHRVGGAPVGLFAPAHALHTLISRWRL